jgi:hypothetical protein
LLHHSKPTHCSQERAALGPEFIEEKYYAVLIFLLDSFLMNFSFRHSSALLNIVFVVFNLR